ncbi:response regulator [Marivirga harenae]|uniref:response regulator n=1 Tax=Marivirga harenae TaxID=2010992 RepID=UPI0026E020C0|nr:response regulator [Marivirga harenae]WKV11432.1 response regulator [Marivirga harenae]|tara:strand:- start:195253 stop:195615 length:363 start_codon:yes stop_codon:yes gene_type:complete
MSKIKYLIIDDDHVFSLWLKTNLADLFPDFEHISSRVDTLGGLLDNHRNEPDLLFLDQYIDGLTGFDVLDLMKHQPKTIMISSESIDKSKLSEYPNVIGFMDKPVDLDKLTAVLKKNQLI